MGKLSLALCALLGCLSLGGALLTPGFAGKPLNFLFKICLSRFGDREISECMQTHLNSGIALVAPMFKQGLPAGDGSLVVLDPLKLDPVSDASTNPPKWEITGIELTGLSGAHVDKLRLTESTIEVEASLERLTAQATLDAWFLPLRPTVRLEVDRPRAILTADWAYVGGDLVFSNSEKIVFLNDGYNVTINSLEVPAGGQQA
ncbi:hypothetical protein FJT64_008003 [Amphibalanus amphitrite]|uniref:Protein takeout n=1 Tax=Amphibalanus amphitrite TaxID=1232801 RepID=A0A6A4VRU5_AMPAM|nr:hypothetical protein FJT64_008003 [Amphibalanus amphitrite]